jgi:hypothetical protein
MPYIVTTTSGTALATIPDNTVNTSTTSLALVGKNYAGYGVFLNENYIKLLENFSNSTAPGAPLSGQLWWDSTNTLIKVWTGSAWKQIHSSAASSTAPTSPITGDLWWDTTNTLLKVWGGSSWVSIGPGTGTGTGGSGIGSSTTGVIADTIVDTGSQSHSVLKISIANNIIAIVSKDSTAFTPQTTIPGFATIYPGMNLISSTALTGSQYTGPKITVGTSSTLTIADAAGRVDVLNNTANIDLNFYVNKAGVSTKAIGISGTTGEVIIPGILTATATSAKYADLAERFAADAVYTPGTVVALGGVKEITAAVNELSEEVFGVISTRAAYLMNGAAGTDETHPAVAVNGRVPVRVIGTVKKGDRLVSAGNGIARSADRAEITAFNVIGRSLEDKYTKDEGTVEAIVKLNS